MSIPASFAHRLSIPVIGSPLFIISNPDLVIAQCKAGVIGSFPSLNARPLAPDEVAPLLVDGDRIEMGEVVFTFHSR